ncbi:MAG: cytochrome c [Rhodobacteraceae bacterium]|nr:cytochrome c [Paracoccaceae bacterium]
MKRNILIAVAIIAAAGIWWLTRAEVAPASDEAKPAGAPIVEVIVPELTGLAVIGETAFNAKCAECHGQNAAGNDQAGPPLVHKIYEPGHHGDAAFLMAAQNGVQSHHWRFGNMPAVEGVTPGDVKAIIAYVRTLQRANGIN